MKNEQELLDSNIKENWFSRVGVQKPYTVFVCIMAILILGVFAFTTLKTELFPNMNLPYAVVILSPDQTQSKITDAVDAVLPTAYQKANLSATVSNTITAKTNDAIVGEMAAIGVAFADPSAIKYENLQSWAKQNPNGPAAAVLALIADVTKETTEAYMSIMPTLAKTMTIATDTQTALSSVSGITKIESMAMLPTGVAVMIIEFSGDTEIEIGAIGMAINNYVTVSNDEKYGVRYNNANIIKLDPSMMPVLSVTVSRSGTGNDWFRNEVLDKISATAGVSTVSTNLPSSTGIGTGDMSWELEDGVLTETVSFQVNKGSSQITTEVVANVIDTLEKIKAADSGGDFDYNIISSQAEYINESLGSVGENLIIGGILAILILFLFLRSVKMTLAIGISIPIAVIATFVAMHFMGIGLNIVSMSGLALAVGMLVDNSVVVLENIYRLRAKGMSIKDSAIRGASQIMGAMLASTLTTICVFFPMFFLTGMLMQVFMDLIWVIVLSLTCSLVVAVMFLPGIISSFKIDVKAKKAAEKVSDGRGNIFVRFWNWIKKAYNSALDFSITKKWLTVLIAVIVFGGSVGLMFINGFTLMPSTDEGSFTVSATLSNNGTAAVKKTLADGLYAQISNELGDNLESCLIRYSSGTDVMSMLSGGGARKMSVNITLKDGRNITTDRAAELVFNAIETADKTSQNYSDISYSSSSMTNGMVASDVSVTFVSNNSNITQGVAELDALCAELKDRVMAEKDRIGITNAQWQAASGRTVSQIDKKTSASITFKTSADTATADAQSQVDAIVAELLGGDFKDMGLSAVDDGFTAQMNETYVSLGIALAVGLVLIYLVMVAIFQSFIMPAIILICIPLAFTGAFILLFICGMPLSVPALIGFLILMGVIVNNGILAVDYTNQARRDGLSVRDALKAAMRTRMRPIFMTAITTILGLFPMALGLSLFGTASGQALMQPLAVVSIGGLLYGTLTTLLVVPAFYAIFCRDKKHIDNVCENQIQNQPEQKSQQAGQTV